MLKIKLLLPTLFILLVGFSDKAFGEVNVEVFPREGSVEDIFRLEISVKDGKDFSTPRFNKSGDIYLESAGTATSQTIINGSVSSEHTFTYRIASAKGLTPGDYQTPTGEIDVDGVTISIESQTFTVNKADKKSSSSQKIPQIDFAQTVDNFHPYVGEQIVYSSKLVFSIRIRNLSFAEFSPDNFWKESFGEAELEQKNVSSSTALVNRYASLFPLSSGEITIPETTLQTEVETSQKRRPSSRRGSVMDQFLFNDLMSFGLRSYQPISLTADPITVQVKDLPPAPFPQKYIPVGSINIDSSFDKDTAKQGESVTLTIKIWGDGNLRPLELPEFPEDVKRNFRIYSDAAELKTQVVKGKILFSKTFKIAFVPNNVGKLNIPELKLLTFNPDTEQYVTRETESIEINVEATPGVAPMIVQQKEPTAQVKEETHPKETATEIQDISPSKKVATQTISKISPSLILAILIIPPLVYFYFLLRKLQQQRRANNPRYFARKEACQQASELLSNKVSSTADVFSIFQEFYSKFFDLPYNSTPTALKKSILDNGGSEELSESVVEIHEKLQETRFSGKESDQATIDSLSSSLQEIVKKISKSIKFSILLACVLNVANIQPSSATDSIEETLKTADSSYHSGDFSSALKAYQNVLSSYEKDNIKSPWLEYNIANTFYMLKQYGSAKAFYLTAKSSLPRNTLIQKNLELTNKKLNISNSEKQNSLFWFPKENLNYPQLLILFSILYCISWSTAIYALKRTRLLPWLVLPLALTIYIAAQTFFTCRNAAGAYEICHLDSRTGFAVITAEAAEVRSGDAESYLVSFILGSGETAKIIQERNGWYQIKDTNDRLGWVSDKQIKKIS